METPGWEGLDAATRKAFERVLQAVREQDVAIVRRSDSPLVESFERGIASIRAINSDICAFENRWSFENLVEQHPGKLSARAMKVLERGRAMSLEDLSPASARARGSAAAAGRDRAARRRADQPLVTGACAAQRRERAASDGRCHLQLPIVVARRTRGNRAADRRGRHAGRRADHGAAARRRAGYRYRAMACGDCRAGEGGLAMLRSRT